MPALPKIGFRRIIKVLMLPDSRRNFRRLVAKRKSTKLTCTFAYLRRESCRLL
jgi:hypothetical protein